MSAGLLRKRRRHELRPWRALTVGLVAGIVAGSTALALTNTLNVPTSYRMDKSHTISTPWTEFRLTQCGAVVGLINVSSGATVGTTGTGNNVLYLNNAGGGTTINGKGGADCFAPGFLGSGTLSIKGGAGAGDVCYNGPGSGTFNRTGCENLPSYPYATVSSSPVFS
jgi:hypothetical protein